MWCAGVTYERCRDARVEEATVKDVYTMVYDAPRPELFLKDAMMRRTVVVADAPHGDDAHRVGRIGLDLLPQAPHVDRHGRGVAVAIAPHPLE